MFRKQVYTSDVDPKTVEDALAITYAQSKKVRFDYYRTGVILSWYFSCWKSLGSTFASFSRNFSPRSQRRFNALVRSPHMLTQS